MLESGGQHALFSSPSFPSLQRPSKQCVLVLSTWCLINGSSNLAGNEDHIRNKSVSRTFLDKCLLLQQGRSQEILFLIPFMFVVDNFSMAFHSKLMPILLQLSSIYIIWLVLAVVMLHFVDLLQICAKGILGMWESALSFSKVIITTFLKICLITDPLSFQCFFPF